MFHTNHLKSILGFTAFLGLSAFASTVNAGQNDANVATDENAVVAKWQEFTETVADYATEQKEEATTSIHNQLQRIDKQITSLEKQVAERSTETREEALEKLKEQQQKVEDWANKLENNSEAAWDETLEGFIDAYEELANALNDATEELSS